MERASGAHVAFLTQDAIPLGTGWLQALLDGFAVADDVGLVFGPYRARPDASPVVARELADWFASFAPSGAPRVDRLAPGEELADLRALLGPRAFFTDANGCVSRAAWERVPFRAAPYAEDHLLALDMLAAGYAKVFQPTAAVEHSHEYPPLAWFRRCFDEWRGLREVYGHVEPVRAVPRNLRGQVRADGLRSLPHWGIRAAGALAGSRADRFPPRVRRAMSLERRASFEPAAPPIRHTPAP
jgi:rhamnosyltransferase